MATYLISELAGRSGVPATTLRYYEQAGLLPAARSPNGYRRYGDDALARLALIRAGRHLGLSLPQLRDLLTLRDGAACTEVRARLRPLLAARMTQARDHAAATAASITHLEQALAATEPDPPPGPCAPGCGCLTTPAPGAAASTSDNSKKIVLLQHSLTPHQQAAPQQNHAPIACSLNGAGEAARLAEWRDLLAQATARQPVTDGLQVTLPAALAAAVAELAAAEQRCCPFFRFTMDFDGPTIRLTIQVPPEARSLLSALTDEPAAPVSS